MNPHLVWAAPMLIALCACVHQHGVTRALPAEPYILPGVSPTVSAARVFVPIRTVVASQVEVDVDASWGRLCADGGLVAVPEDGYRGEELACVSGVQVTILNRSDAPIDVGSAPRFDRERPPFLGLTVDLRAGPDSSVPLRPGERISILLPMSWFLTSNYRMTPCISASELPWILGIYTASLSDGADVQATVLIGTSRIVAPAIHIPPEEILCEVAQ